MGSRRPELPLTDTQPPNTQPRPALTKAAGVGTRTANLPASRAWHGPSEAGARQTGVVPTLAHSGSFESQIPPAAQL